MEKKIFKLDEREKRRQQRMIDDKSAEAKRGISVSDSEIKEFEKILNEGLTYAEIEERGFTLTKAKFCVKEINRRKKEEALIRKPISVWPVDPKRNKREYGRET